MGNLHSQFTYDDSLGLKDAGLVASTTTETTIVDLGAGFVDGFLVVDVTACEVDSSNEIFDICLEGSNVAAMGSGSVQLSRFRMGYVSAPADASTSTGRFIIPITNEQNGTCYRYVRLYTFVSGTIASGINYSAFLAKR
jgi:hypothetical protein